jgi:cation:H+ antiporter
VPALLLALGLVLLVGGGDLLVRGSSRLALAAGLTPLVVGLTVVAYGTSAPELAVSLGAALVGSSELGVGNVVGSNIFNVLFILGLTAMVAPLRVEGHLVRRDVPILIGVTLLAVLLALDGGIGRAEGILLLALGLLYSALALAAGRIVESERDDGAETARRGSVVPSLLLVGAGIGLLVLGSRWVVAGASAIAGALGVSDLVVGLTVVAAGTSLPEVAASVIAGLKGERDIAVGNIIGSNIFNLVFVLGGAAAAAPGQLAVSASALRFDLPVMLAVALCLPIFLRDRLVERWEGAVLFGYYWAYTGFVVLAAIRHAALPLYGRALLFVVLPLTVLTLVVMGLRRDGRRERE